MNKQIQSIEYLELSPLELWYLAKFFGPGVIYGVNDPTLGMSQEEITQTETEVEKSLLTKGLIQNKENNKIGLEESVVPLIFSCVHPKHVLTIKNVINQEEKIYYFLPKWQLELKQKDGNYVLSPLQEREEIVNSTLSEIDASIIKNDITFQVDVNERILELAIYLFEQQKREKAIEELILAGVTDFQQEILQAFINPFVFLQLNMVYHTNERILINSTQMQLIQSNKFLLQTSRYYHGDEQVWKLEIKALSFEAAEESLVQLLPKN